MIASLAAPPLEPFLAIPFAQAAIEELCPLGPIVKIGSHHIRCPVGPFPFIVRAIRVRGWMLMPDGPFDRIHAHVNGREFFTCKPQERGDLAAAFPHIPGAGRGQFNFEIPRQVARKGRIDIVGRRNGAAIGRMRFRFHHRLQRSLPTPPPRLTLITADTQDAYYYHAGGYKSFDEINGALVRFPPDSGIRRLLDWGCGCGRLAAHWVRQGRIPEIHGCDINADAIRWCQAHLPSARFTRVALDPPTPYPDSYFDAIAAYSVFTHLTQPAQAKWLAEMHRVLKPGGTFAASVHGPSAAWFRFGPKADAILQSGIHDQTLAAGMEEIVGQNVYCDTYQTREYTQRAFGRWFDVLEYAERAVGNNQDLVVLRKPT
jgi:ubiquinone/menaquinone biosynthesis C-methylase UbiE